MVEASRDPYVVATTTVPRDPTPHEVQAFLDRQLPAHGQRGPGSLRVVAAAPERS